MSSMIVPTIASASATRLDGGTLKYGTGSYEWADYSYHQVYAYITTYTTVKYYDRVYGWQSCHTATLQGTVLTGTGQTGFGNS